MRTDRGIVRARNIVSALEGYGATVAQTKRRILPLYSLMVATQPLDDAVWDAMGIAHGQTFWHKWRLVSSAYANAGALEQGAGTGRAGVVLGDVRGVGRRYSGHEPSHN